MSGGSITLHIGDANVPNVYKKETVTVEGYGIVYSVRLASKSAKSHSAITTATGSNAQ